MKRFSYAFQGMWVLLKKDYKFLMHLITAFVVVCFGFFFNISRIEWLLIIVSIGLVIAFEVINTAVEYVVDLVTEDYHPLAKHAKDVAAFSVLIAVIVAFIVGLLIFIPHIFK
ncbi:diacylglycerol kinase family protein [Staphylococcus sp. HKU1]|uniref:diacylglycerol kinase family protein n=1 Tax=unclassified Staphylococcus TaxID=91994 RepID=UPI00203BA0C5|nr:diacylglycerol kinase family protein [Staphylococcus sp. Marseille-Q6910]